MRIRSFFVAAIAAISLVAACGGKKASDGDTMAKPTKKLFDRLGGQAAIEKVIDDFIKIVVADARINEFFKSADAGNLKKQLVDQVCNATGGPCEYKGKDMKTAHTGLKITDAHFDALVEDLVKALKDNKVADADIKELGDALGGMRKEIVGQ